MSASARQSVAYAGEPGAFAEDAVIAGYPDAERVPVPSFGDVFGAVARREVDLGVVPIENLVNGTVRETYDLLLQHELEIVAEVVVPVRLCLAALPGQGLEDIERIYSHIQALGQAEPFLRQRRWTLMSTYNTAGSGKLIADRAERGAAAVLSPRAAASLGLEILADGIQEVPDNRTRFLVLARPSHAPVPGARASGPVAGMGRGTAPGSTSAEPPFRTTLVFGVRNAPGTLLAALQAFAARGVNLSKLESRPSRSAAWEYVFWADLDGGADDPLVAASLDDLRRVSTMVRVLGSYPRTTSA